MKKLMIPLIVLLVYGCSTTAPKTTMQKTPVLLHETSESRLLTKEEFMARVSQSATQVYEGLRTISEAADRYAIDHDGSLPFGTFRFTKSLLLDGGYLEEWPVIPPFALTEPGPYEFRYANGYGDMDGLAPLDDVIYAQDLKIEVCQAFARRYSSFGPDDIIHDYHANGDKAPGETLGKHMKVYAMIWEMDTRPDYCDAIWVVKYNDASKPGTERKPEK